MCIAGSGEGNDAVLLIAGIHHFKQLSVLHLLHNNKKKPHRPFPSASESESCFSWQLLEQRLETYLCEFLLLLVDLFTFARGKNLLHQFLHSVVVHRVGVDVPAELMKVPSLLAKANKICTK